MQIDVFIPPGLTAGQTIALGKLAEDSGIGAVWTYSYIADPDQFVNLSFLADATSDIRMGPVAVSPMQLHPLMMANSLLTLNEISQGRANIVVGGGGAILAAMGTINAPRKVTAVRECVEFLKEAAVSRERMVNYQGEIYTVKGYDPYWITAAPPRIYVGANGSQMARMAAKIADGVMMSDFTVPMVKDIAGTIHQAREESGQNGQDFQINNYFAWHLKDDREESFREARRYMALRGVLHRQYLESFLDKDDCDFIEAHAGAIWRAYHRKTHVIEGIPDRLMDAMIENLTLSGDLTDLDRIMAHLEALRDAGQTEVALGLHDDPEEGIRQIGRYVVPALGG